MPRNLLAPAVEKLLIEQIVPYVSIHEARPKLSNPKLVGFRNFHFVAYDNLEGSRPNWLLFAAHLDKEARDHMRQWEKIFGTGFVAVVAQRNRQGALIFHDLNGLARRLPDNRPVNPTPTVPVSPVPAPSPE